MLSYGSREEKNSPVLFHDSSFRLALANGPAASRLSRTSSQPLSFNECRHWAFTAKSLSCKRVVTSTELSDPQLANSTVLRFVDEKQHPI
jgi:hypothetical protein